MCPQTVLSGDVYTSLSVLVDMMNVSLELLDSPNATGQKPCSLARLVLTLRFEHEEISNVFCVFTFANLVWVNFNSGSKRTIQIRCSSLKRSSPYLQV